VAPKSDALSQVGGHSDFVKFRECAGHYNAWKDLVLQCASEEFICHPFIVRLKRGN
jgi:hypothetical protein